MLNEQTARTMAKNWRAGNANVRSTIERAITARDGWSAFVWGKGGQLLAKVTPEYSASIRGADCHFYNHGARDGI